MEHLPFVLLGLRSSVREDSACSPADILYGSPLRLTGPLLDNPGHVPDPACFAAELQGVMAASRPFPVLNYGTPRSRVDPALSNATHVFMRVDAVKRPLVPPYEGPFQVLSRTSKTFVILKRGKPVTVTVDRLKPAFFLPESSTALVSSAAPDVRPPPASPGPLVPPSLPVPVATPAPPPDALRLDAQEWPLPTRYGRRPLPPTHLNIYYSRFTLALSSRCVFFRFCVCLSESVYSTAVSTN